MTKIEQLTKVVLDGIGTDELGADDIEYTIECFYKLLEEVAKKALVNSGSEFGFQSTYLGWDGASGAADEPWDAGVWARFNTNNVPTWYVTLLPFNPDGPWEDMAEWEV